LSIEDDEDLDLEDDILSSDVIDSLDTDDFEEGDDNFEEEFTISNELYSINNIQWIGLVEIIIKNIWTVIDLLLKQT
jgi:hypothetical protein